MTREPEPSNAALIGRREAIRRAALLAGVALAPEWLEFAGRAQTPATKAYLTSAHGSVVSAAAERILPRTDTPGAIDVGVPAFIDRFYGEFMNPADRQLLVTALDEIERAAKTAHDASFAALTAAQQDAVLRSIATAQQGRDPELVRTAAIRDRARLLHVGTGREERASLRSRARRLRRLPADRSSGPSQLDHLKPGPAPATRPWRGL